MVSLGSVTSGPSGLAIELARLHHPLPCGVERPLQRLAVLLHQAGDVYVGRSGADLAARVHNRRPSWSQPGSTSAQTHHNHRQEFSVRVTAVVVEAVHAELGNVTRWRHQWCHY